MKQIFGFAAALAVVGVIAAPAAQAHPLLIEESGVIANPDPTLTTCCHEVAIDGDDAIMLGRRDQPDPDPTGYDDTYVRAMHFHRGTTGWAYIGLLAETLLGNEADAPNQFAVAMRDGIAAVAMLQLSVFERTGGVYTAVPDDHSLGAPSQYLEIDGGNILFGDGSWGGSILRKGSDGVWHSVAGIHAGYSGDGDGANGGPVAISGASAAVFDPYNIDELPPGLVMFRNLGGNDWQQVQRITAQPGHELGYMALSGGIMYVNDDPRYGTPRYFRSADNQWRPSGLTLRADGDHRLINNYQGGFGYIRVGDNFVLRQAWDADKQASIVQVFQYVAPNVLGQVATLAASDGARLNGHMALNGRRVVVGAAQKAYVFDLPQQPRAPALIQHTFEDSSAAAWSITSGEFMGASGESSNVFRSDSAGLSAAVLDAANWTHQSIQVDVKPLSLNGSDRWVGLATRYADAANYYYVTLRSSGVIELKRMYHGSFVTLDSASLPFTLNRNYRLRLESVGSRQRVYVDGALVLEALDRDLAQGRPALLTNRAVADFDNVVVSPADVATLWWRTGSRVCNDSLCAPVDWQTADGDWSWQTEGGNEYFSQSSLTTAGRAPAGASTRNIDQVVESRVRLRAWGSANDPWVGLMARYQDLNNYVYLSWRRSNTLTLRKLVNGQIQELGAVSLPLAAGTWNLVKLDAVGKWLRAYVNGRQVLEVVDPQPTPGQVGVVTNRAQADFDDFIAVRP